MSKIHEPQQAYSPVFLTKQYAHKFHQYNQYIRLKKPSVNRCVTIRSEDREIIASSTRSNERRQALRAIGEFQGRDEYQRRLGDSKARRLKRNASNFRMRTEIISLAQK